MLYLATRSQGSMTSSPHSYLVLHTCPDTAGLQYPMSFLASESFFVLLACVVALESPGPSLDLGYERTTRNT